jgi:hypothetical protein
VSSDRCSCRRASGIGHSERACGIVPTNRISWQHCASRASRSPSRRHCPH